ncbi:MAG: DegT/DnrJ/EryC1/StrS family aminotransferase [Chitinivibrionales bacterium]|nr:DegT/DnrJ/EryC1/StrS family aminotransferase [Chitinivibrionales bacterium]
MLIPHSKPWLNGKERNALLRVLASGHLCQGENVAILEREIAAYSGHRYGVAVSSGTAALYLALLSLKVGSGDAVIIPSYVCTAVLNAVAMAGAKPIVCDVDAVTANMDIVHIRKVLHKKVRAIIVAHLFGYPADIAAINSLGIPVIEDCAQCIGATIHGRRVGGLSAIAVFSLYATKVVAAGQGGLIATSDKNIARFLRDFREYDNQDTYYPRFNFKLSDLHAAIAVQQLKKIRQILARRRRIASFYSDVLARYSPHLLLPQEPAGIDPMYYRYVIRMPKGGPSLIRKMKRSGVICARPIYKPLHHYLHIDGFENSQRLFEQAVSIPCYPALSQSQIEFIANALKQFFT